MNETCPKVHPNQDWPQSEKNYTRENGNRIVSTDRWMDEQSDSSIYPLR